VSEASTVYEIRCPACRVTFPPEQRHCFYCGQRLGGPFETPAERDERHEPEAIRQTLPFRGAVTLLWVLLALAAAAFRICAGER
jgi:hypothetical protein